MNKLFPIAAPSTAPVELTAEMLDSVSGGDGGSGNNGIGQILGPMLRSMGGMSGMMASMGKAPGADMGKMLGTVGGMKSAMTMGDMG